MCFVEANLIKAGYQNEVPERQRRRLDEGDRNDSEFRVVMIALTNMDVGRAIDAICDYLNWDNDLVAAAPESLRFPEFEHLEPTLRH